MKFFNNFVDNFVTGFMVMVFLFTVGGAGYLLYPIISERWQEILLVIVGCVGFSLLAYLIGRLANIVMNKWGW